MNLLDLEQIIGNDKIYKTMQYCFGFLSERDQNKFIKKFKEIPISNIQSRHIFCELLLGAYLSSEGFLVEYERKFNKVTPDWCIKDSNFEVIAIVEMTYHHLDHKTNNLINAQIKAGKKAFAYFPHSNDPNFNRLFSQIYNKTIKYKKVAMVNDIPYVVAIFIDFTAVIDVEETTNCITEELFKKYPELSGVLHFEEHDLNCYSFCFIKNPFAKRKFEINSGYLLKGSKTNPG